ncbi:MAG: cupin domain-containing protein [Bacteroidia bacterium]|nr:cupin domain-containing protein [Bacteroidia bacterium]MCZ2278200.1 cupin domain-containing protein [Bacteroidia bacterium]
MTEKSNISTQLRPEGDRLLNASLVEMDLKKYLSQIKQETIWKEGSHNSITLFKSDTLRIVLIGMHHGAVLKTHQAKANVSVQVLEGEVTFTADDQELKLQASQMVAIQAKVPHSVKAETESAILLTVAALG